MIQAQVQKMCWLCVKFPKTSIIGLYLFLRIRILSCTLKPEEVVSLPPETSQRSAGIATYNQPSAIRDEELCDAVRSFNVLNSVLCTMSCCLGVETRLKV